MIEPTDWIKFSDEEDALAFLRKNGLVSAKAAREKSFFCYIGAYAKTPMLCRVVGHASPFTAVIELSKALHCINTDLLFEMQSGMSKWLREAESLLALDTYISLDVETTGFSAATDKMIEIAAIKYINGEEAESFVTLINPGCEISKEITRLTGITNDDVIGAPSAIHILENLKIFLDKHQIIAHNAPFDKSFLEHAYDETGYTLPNDFIDTLKLARQRFPSLVNHKLQSLIAHFKLDGGDAHRAASDARATAQLFEICRRSFLQNLHFI